MDGHITQSQADEYALGALEPEIERLVTLHASDCDQCRERVFAAERAVAYVALNVPRVAAPRAMKQRVFVRAGIRRPPAIVRVARLGRAVAGIAAAFVAIAAFTGMLAVRGDLKDVRQENVQLARQIDDVKSRDVQIFALSQGLKEAKATADDLQTARERDRELLAALLSPESDIADVSPLGSGNTSIGRLVWEADQSRIWFVAQRLPTLPEGQTYQIWLMSEGDYFSLGAFNSDETGSAVHMADVPAGIGRYDSALVTIETLDGLPGRRGEGVFFVADLARTSQ